MIKYLIRGTVEGRVLNYAGRHYEPSGAFSPDNYHATLYADINDAMLMVDALSARFDTRFYVVTIKVNIQEIQQKGYTNG